MLLLTDCAIGASKLLHFGVIYSQILNKKCNHCGKLSSTEPTLMTRALSEMFRRSHLN